MFCMIYAVTGGVSVECD